MRLLQEKKQQRKDLSRRCISVWNPVWLEKNTSREVAGKVVGVGGAGPGAMLPNQVFST